MKVKFLKQNWLIVYVFILSTLFFILQHMHYISWDFAVYVSNAKYWFSNSVFYEVQRTPLMPLLIGLFSFFKFFKFGEYAYIIIINLLYCFMCIKLAEKTKIDKNLFYVLSLNPFVLFFGLVNGTELLALSLIGLFVVSLLEKKDGGLYLGLSAIARYPLLPLGLLVLFYNSPKKIIKNIVYFLIPITVWFGYSLIKTGNALTYFADSYALNFSARSYFNVPFNFMHILIVGNVLLIFLVYFIFRLFSDKNFRTEQKKDMMNYIMFLILAFTIYSYATTPEKLARYLFNITLPIAYFSTKALNNRKKLTVIIAVLFFAFSLFNLYGFYNADSLSRASVEKNIQELSAFNLGNCSIRSNMWTLLSYYGYRATANRPDLQDKYMEKGDILVLFLGYGSYENRTYEQSKIIGTGTRFIILGNLSSCTQKDRVYSSYLSEYNETIYLVYNETAEYTPEDILFKKVKI